MGCSISVLSGVAACYLLLMLTAGGSSDDVRRCGDVLGIPDMRGQIFPGSSSQGQMAALELPNVGYATNADHGMGCGA